MKLGLVAILLLVLSFATRNPFIALLLVCVSVIGLIRSHISKEEKKKDEQRLQLERQHQRKRESEQKRAEQREASHEMAKPQPAFSDDSHTETKYITLFNRPLVLHPDLEGLIWFADGPLKNYDPKHTRVQAGECDLTISISSNEEPSAIKTGLSIILPKDGDYIAPLGYYPSYAALSPEQRGRYIQFLSNPYQIIDIGYVFILYYGLERHLLMGDFDRAFDIVLRLRGIHSNDSFQYYSTGALVYSASRRNRKDKLQCFIDSVTNEFEKQAIPFDIFISVKAALSMNILPKEMMQYAASFAFTNKRYIQSDYSIFSEQLALALQEKYAESSFPIRLLHLDGLPASKAGLANYSISATFEVPDISADHSFIEAGASVLQEAHDRVKRIKRARNSMKASL